MLLYKMEHAAFILSTLFQPSLGVDQSAEALLYVIASPVGPYFPTGMKPVSLLADPKYVRAWPGGSGNCKLGS